MGWWGGEWVEGSMCEDAPCCGCCGPGSDDPAWSPYGQEEDMYGFDEGDDEWYDAEDDL